MRMRPALLLLSALAVSAPARPADNQRNSPPVERAARRPEGARRSCSSPGRTSSRPASTSTSPGCAVLADLLQAERPASRRCSRSTGRRSPRRSPGRRRSCSSSTAREKHGASRATGRRRCRNSSTPGSGSCSSTRRRTTRRTSATGPAAWAGGAWEKGIGKRAHWVEEFKTFPDHPICRGVTPFKIDDGWLCKIKFVDGMKGVTPLLRTWNPKATTKPTGAQDVVAWAYDRPGGGRSFIVHRRAPARQPRARGLPASSSSTASCGPPGSRCRKTGAKVELDAEDAARLPQAAPRQEALHLVPGLCLGTHSARQSLAQPRQDPRGRASQRPRFQAEPGNEM